MGRTTTTKTTTAPTVSGGSITGTTAPLSCEQPERQPEHDETPEPDDEEDNGLTRPATPLSAHAERGVSGGAAMPLRRPTTGA